MEETLKHIAQLGATLIELVSAVLIGFAVVQATYHLVSWALRQDAPFSRAIRRLRLTLGQWLVLALEFLIAADILQTAVAPTWDELGKLAVIIVLRTALNYFLEREIESVERHERLGESSPEAPPLEGRSTS